MKSLILAAGYATRLYPLTINKPKPLLEVGGLPIIHYILKKLKKLKLIDEIIIVSNQRFHHQFKEWLEGSKISKAGCKRMAVISDGTTSQENKLGAIRDIDFAIRKEEITEDLLVIAGDNLFEEDMSGFMKFAMRKSPASTIGLHRIKDMTQVGRYGCVEVDSSSIIKRFWEKCPGPLSGLVAMCLYYLSCKHIQMLNEYIKGGNNLDAPGYFIRWLVEKDRVYGFEFEGAWYDIGDKISYLEAVRKFKDEVK